MATIGPPPYLRTLRREADEMRTLETSSGAVHVWRDDWALIGVEDDGHVMVMARQMRAPGQPTYKTKIDDLMFPVRWNLKKKVFYVKDFKKIPQPPTMISHYARLVALQVMEKRG